MQSKIMEYLMYFLAWYLIGFISTALTLYFIDKTLTYRDLINSFCGGFGGALTFIACIIVFLKEFNLLEYLEQKIDIDKRIL